MHKLIVRLLDVNRATRLIGDRFALSRRRARLYRRPTGLKTI